ncbi:Peptidase C97 domain containing protein [Asbolus verrucosus]|uniref:Peptidase C97 domain containing protein n=1 Tax=Asbolus verrucosus TaxID=1661398 RepID=A0A482WAW6_ASBVE|nr:Peptidase C97 domain containing protein [Asbolus verrucosus]
MSYPVEVYIYDLSGGWCQNIFVNWLSPTDEALHSGVVVHGREYFYGKDGLEDQKPDLKNTIRKAEVGRTKMSKTEVAGLINNLRRQETWRKQLYDAVNHNCHHFSDTLVKCLCGPQARLPQEVYDFNKQIAATWYSQTMARTFTSSGSS